MFWARTSAIYQIFNEKIIKNTPEEKGQTDGTIMHGIERIWLYLVKLNGFDYKTILYYIYFLNFFILFDCKVNYI